MTRFEIGVLGGCVALGSSLAMVSPGHWGIGFTQAALLGGATYAVALRGYLARLELQAAMKGERHPARWIPGLVVRALGFMGMAGFQAYLCFEVVPHADVRPAFAVLSTWVVVQALTAPNGVRVSRRTSG